LDATLLDVSSKIFAESQTIKVLMTGSKDIVLMSSMWDSCVIAKTQLDAYFSMLGIFNTIKNENLTEETINYLVNWLDVMKKTNALNMKSLTGISPIYEPTTELHVKRLNGYFAELNYRIDGELKKISSIKEALKLKKTKAKE
jgi:hypothetical protein